MLSNAVWFIGEHHMIQVMVSAILAAPLNEKERYCSWHS